MELSSCFLKEFSDISTFADVDEEFKDEEMYTKMAIDEWNAAKNMGIYKNDDGCGYYGTDSKISNIEVFTQEPPKGMNFVYWFNK